MGNSHSKLAACAMGTALPFMLVEVRAVSEGRVLNARRSSGHSASLDVDHHGLLLLQCPWCFSKATATTVATATVSTHSDAKTQMG